MLCKSFKSEVKPETSLSAVYITVEHNKRILSTLWLPQKASPASKNFTFNGIRILSVFFIMRWSESVVFFLIILIFSPPFLDSACLQQTKHAQEKFLTKGGKHFPTFHPSIFKTLVIFSLSHSRSSFIYLEKGGRERVIIVSQECLEKASWSVTAYTSNVETISETENNRKQKIWKLMKIFDQLYELYFLRW